MLSKLNIISIMVSLEIYISLKLELNFIGPFAPWSWKRADSITQNGISVGKYEVSDLKHLIKFLYCSLLKKLNPFY